MRYKEEDYAVALAKNQLSYSNLEDKVAVALKAHKVHLKCNIFNDTWVDFETDNDLEACLALMAKSELFLEATDVTV